MPMTHTNGICRPLCAVSICAASYLIASLSALAQTRPIQAPVLQAPLRAPVAALVRQHSFAPTITLTNVDPPALGRLQTFNFKVSGLKGAKTVHLFQFNPGCDFERQLGVSGLRIRLETIPSNARRYTTDSSPEVTRRANFRDPVGDGLVLDANGEATFLVTGVLGVGPGRELVAQNTSPDATTLQSPGALDRFARGIVTEPTSCTPSAAFVFLGGDRRWYTLDFDDKLRDVNEEPLVDLFERKGRPYMARPRRVVSVVETKRLKDLLAPAMPALAAGSICKGVSTAIGQPAHAVGMGEKDGDLTFTIRSGPAGTRCGIVFNQAPLPAGVTVTSARFSVERVGSRCQLGRGSVPQDLVGFFGGVGFNLSRVSGVVRQPAAIVAGTLTPAATGWLNPFEFPDPGRTRLQWQAHFAPMGGVLSCDATAFNDHAVTLRFDSAEFLVPDGVDLAIPLQ